MWCPQTKAVYLNHRPSPWLSEAATRDRSNRLLDVSLRSTLGHVHSEVFASDIEYLGVRHQGMLDPRLTYRLNEVVADLALLGCTSRPRLYRLVSR